MSDRAVVFVDGNNWFHSLRAAAISDLGRLDYALISRKLVGPRAWRGTRYYIGQVSQGWNRRLYAAQRRFLDDLRSTDARITCHLGRLEERTSRNEAADELRQYLAALRVQIDRAVYRDLQAIAQRHRQSTIIVEKAVDVMLAVDMVIMAERDEFDAAYLLSADGDYTHAVGAVRSIGKRVYAVSPSSGAQLAAAADAFVRLKGGWFADCYASRV